MKKALISPNEKVQYISSWTGAYPNVEQTYSIAGTRIAEVSQNQFEVAEPLFWVDCEDFVTAENYCYDNGSIIEIPADAEKPVGVITDQPTPASGSIPSAVL